MSAIRSAAASLTPLLERPNDPQLGLGADPAVDRRSLHHGSQRVGVEPLHRAAVEDAVVRAHEAQVPRHPHGGELLIAGEHHRPDPRDPERGDRLAHAGGRRVGEPDAPCPGEPVQL
jgi:hypothetical protein